MHWEAPPAEIPGINTFLLLQFSLAEKFVLFGEILTSKHLLSSCQQQLPATGVPVTRQRFDHMRKMFDEYVRNRTLQNWKFWIVSFYTHLMNLGFGAGSFRAKNLGFWCCDLKPSYLNSKRPQFSSTPACGYGFLQTLLTSTCER